MALGRNDTSPLFAESALSTLTLIAYLVGAVVLMVADHRNAYLTHLRQGLSTLIEPVYRLAALPAVLMQDASLALSDRSKLIEENGELKRVLLLAQARLTRLSTLQEQNQRLQELLEVQQGLGMGAQLARLINVDLDPFRHRIMLDLGSTSGVREGQAVIDAHGIMGQVIEALPNTSTVMLITDPNHALPVVIERTGLRTIAYGSGAVDRLELPNIPISAEVKIGDTLITSGLGGRFPAGFPVGIIHAVSSDASGMFATAVATPSAALDRSGEVLLLRDLADPVGPPALAPPMGPPATPDKDAP